MLAPWKKSYDQTRQHIKKQRHYLANKGLSNQSYGFPSGHVWMWELDHKESWAPKNWYFWTVVLEKTLESPLDWKTWQQAKCLVLREISPEYSLEGLMLKLKLWYLATWCKELILWKRPWCWERLKAGGEGDNRGWDGWMASPTQWTWVWASCVGWWWTGRPGVLQSVGSQRVGHDWVTELNWLTRWGNRGTEWLGEFARSHSREVAEPRTDGLCPGSRVPDLHLCSPLPPDNVEAGEVHVIHAHLVWEAVWCDLVKLTVCRPRDLAVLPVFTAD